MDGAEEGLSYKTTLSSGGTILLEIGFTEGQGSESPDELNAYIRSLGDKMFDPDYGDTYSLAKAE